MPTLPYGRFRDVPRIASPGRHAGPSGHGGPPLRVLLVDDHDIVREGLAAMLREAPGIELVGEAADGRKAINMAIDLQPDVVLMDVSMPLMSGDQATRQIKAYLPETRVIALSMYEERRQEGEMFRAGAEGYILKTVSAEELLAALRGRADLLVGDPARGVGKCHSPLRPRSGAKCRTHSEVPPPGWVQASYGDSHSAPASYAIFRTSSVEIPSLAASAATVSLSMDRPETISARPWAYWAEAFGFSPSR